MTSQAAEKWRGPPPYDYYQRPPYPVRRGPPPPNYTHRPPHYASGPPPLRGGPPPLPQHPAASHRPPADYWYPYDSAVRGPPREHVPPPYSWTPPHSQPSSFPRPTVSSNRDQYARGPPPQYHQHDPYRMMRNEKQESSSQRASSPTEESWSSKGKTNEARDRPEESSGSKGSSVTDPKQADPLSLLAKVSSTMAPPKSRQAKKEAVESSKAPPPTSPMSAKKRTSPVNTPGPSRRSENPTLITPTVSYGPYESGDARPPPYYPYGGSMYPPYHGPPPYYREWGGEFPPAVVERNSFDSGESLDGRPRFSSSYYPSPRSRSSRGRAPPETPDLRWSYPPEYGPPPPPHYLPPRPTPESRVYPGDFGPYTYVQHPTVEEKVILRKKFSWKHYPELERFLIEHRDEYLNHSSRNYTVEQKQFNNMLTEELIKLAARHNYAFDPQDFNFVAIRDRIRCYYKSYVQTARKRGLMLPSTSVSKKGKKSEHDGDEELSDGEESSTKEMVTNE